MNGDYPAPAGQPSDDSNWQYVASPQEPNPQPVNQQQPAPQPAPSITWQASEFVAHHKGFGWYALFVLAAAVLVGLVYLITKDIISVAVIFVLAILFGISAARKPRVLAYKIDNHGLTAGQRFYSYSEFKSFSLVHEGAFTSMEFLPLKRFMPTISIYYEPNDEARIFEVISQYLPFEQRSNDVIDRLARRIRF